MSLLVRSFDSIGNMAVRPVTALGEYTLFLYETIKRCAIPPIKARLLFIQLEFVGNRSFAIIVISAVMVGAIFGLILGDIFRTFGAESMLGAAAAFALSKELAPVFAGFLVTARAGSAMAAEIATMRVNEQIDAMRVMAVNPYNYLVAPRVVAAVIMLPLLTCVFIITGVVTAFIIGVSVFDVDVGIFFDKMKWINEPRFIVQGMQKAAVFGLILASIGCFKGFFAGGGAKGVGRATTEAVVVSLVAIIVSDFFLSYLQFDQAL